MEVFNKKQPWEEYYVAFDFTNALGSSSIASATVTATDSLGVDATSTITTVGNQAIDSPQVNVWVKGGVSGQTYKITCKIVTDSDPAEKFELDAKLPVLDI